MNGSMVMTVSGPVPAESLGITLPHEHIILDLSCWWSQPANADRNFVVDALVKDLDRECLVADPYHNRDNLVLDDLDLAESELNIYKQAGGATIVDLSTRSIGPFPEQLQELAVRTGLNIIAGTGFYVKRSHPDFVERASTTELAELLINDLTHGIEGTSIRAGVIGEIGTSSPLHPDEEKVLRAAAQAHLETGAPINVHLTIFAREGHRILDLLEECGVDPRYVALSHLDELLDWEYHESLARRGSFLEFDCLGSECRFDEDHVREPTDAERIDALIALLDAGYENQLLLSQDVCTKMQLRRYGGNGYDHVLRSVIPQLKARGVDEETVNTILIQNPARFLTARK
ncbi:MAG: phosphotriesterase-related protein [Cyanobacteria bacterium]|nr:phosphotriesterase-related protein [Cyanobacteriota bacterium]